MTVRIREGDSVTILTATTETTMPADASASVVKSTEAIFDALSYIKSSVAEYNQRDVDWADAGDLAYVRQQLAEVAAFLRGEDD